MTPSRQGAAEEDLADLMASAALAVPGVAALHPGTYGEVATYLPGRSVTGIQVRDDRAAVHLVLEWGAPVRSTAAAVQERLALLAGRPVDVTVQDVTAPS